MPETPGAHPTADELERRHRQASRERNDLDRGAAFLDALAALRSAERRAVDDPEWDGTDFAHPAWWRGEEAGVRGVVRGLTKLLDGAPHHGTHGYAPLEALAQRIAALRSAEQERDEAVRTLRELVAAEDAQDAAPFFDASHVRRVVAAWEAARALLSPDPEAPR